MNVIKQQFLDTILNDAVMKYWYWEVSIGIMFIQSFVKIGQFGSVLLTPTSESGDRLTDTWTNTFA
jgi:hypothetical protein